METTQFAKQTLNFQKSVFDSSYNAISMIQDQTGKMVSTYMEKLPWMTEESKKTMENSIDMANKARDTFKKSVDEGFSKLEELVEKK